MAITRPSLEHAMKVKATSGLTDFLKSQRSAEDTVKDIIFTNAKNAALQKLEKLGASDRIKELVKDAKTVEGIRALMDEATPSLEANISKEDQVDSEVSKEAPMDTETPMTEALETEIESEEATESEKDTQAKESTTQAEVSNGNAMAPAVKPIDDKKPAMALSKDKAPAKVEDTKKTDPQLPVTGDKANPFFTGAALPIIVSVGMVTLSCKRKEN